LSAVVFVFVVVHGGGGGGGIEALAGPSRAIGIKYNCRF